MAAAGVQAELEEAGVEAGRAPGQAHVAAQGQVHAGADGGAVDGGERRQRRAPDPQEALVDRAQPVAWSRAAGRAEVAEVGAGAERGRRAGDDDGADVGVGFEPVEGGDDLVDQLEGQGVAALGVVEGDDGDAGRRPDLGPASDRVTGRGRRRASGGRTARRRARSGSRAGARRRCAAGGWRGAKFSTAPAEV